MTAVGASRTVLPMDTYNYRHFHAGHLVSDAAGTAELRGPQPGSFAPDFTLDDTAGRAWDLRAQRGRPVLLHFGSFT